MDYRLHWLWYKIIELRDKYELYMRVSNCVSTADTIWKGSKNGEK